MFTLLLKPGLLQNLHFSMYIFICCINLHIVRIVINKIGYYQTDVVFNPP